MLQHEPIRNDVRQNHLFLAGRRLKRCMWLLYEEMAEELRPHRSKVVLHCEPDGKVVVRTEPSRPNAWREGRMGRFLQDLAKNGTVVVIAHEGGRSPAGLA